MKRVLIVVTAALGLCGCVAVPGLDFLLVGCALDFRCPALELIRGPAEPKRMTMEQVCDPTRDKRDDIPAFVALCPSTP